MTTKTYRYYLLILLATTVYSGIKSADFGGVITKYDVAGYIADDIRLVSVNNQKGNTTIKGWQKDSIRIETTVSMETSSKKTASEIVENIYFTKEINNHNLQVSWKPNSDYQINIPLTISYVIHIPESLILRVNGSSGHLIIENITGGIDVAHEYGSAALSQIMSNTENKVSLKSSNANIIDSKNLNIKGENCQLYIRNCNELVLNTMYTNHNLQNIRKLDCISNYSKFNIPEIEEIQMTGKGSRIEIGKLTKYGLIELDKGSININEIDPGVTELNIANIEAPIELHVRESMPFFINGQNEQGGIVYPWPDKIRIINDLSTTSFSGQNGAVNSLSTKLILFNQLSTIQIIAK